MRECERYRELILLDVHDEIAQDGRLALEGHLRGCAVCRQERAQILSLLERIRKALPYPEPTEEEKAALGTAISRALRKEKAEKGRRWRVLGLPLPPLPALAAASLLLVTMGWLGIRWIHQPPPSFSLANIETEERLIVQNLDLLENLDLLDDMETIQKLVQVVDQKDSVL